MVCPEAKTCIKEAPTVKFLLLSVKYYCRSFEIRSMMMVMVVPWRTWTNHSNAISFGAHVNLYFHNHVFGRKNSFTLCNKNIKGHKQWPTNCFYNWFLHNTMINLMWHYISKIEHCHLLKTVFVDLVDRLEIKWSNINTRCKIKNYCHKRG